MGSPGHSAGRRRTPVIAYDRRGFGWSSQPWDGYDYDTLATDLHALLEHRDVRRATLVGLSMGGGEVARYIATYGTDRVAKAVLAAAATPNPEGGVDDALIAQFRDGLRADRLAFLEGFFRTWFAANEQPDLVSAAQRSYALQIAAFASPKGTLDCIDAIARTDFSAELEKVTVPTLVIHGEADVGVPWEVTAKPTHEAIAGSKLVIIGVVRTASSSRTPRSSTVRCWTSSSAESAIDRLPTHDTKRSGDVRARIGVLSTIAEQWGRARSALVRADRGARAGRRPRRARALADLPDAGRRFTRSRRSAWRGLRREGPTRGQAPTSTGRSKTLTGRRT